MTSRRQFLRGAGACLALPFMPSLAGASSAPPRRLLWLMWDNGAPMSQFDAVELGSEWLMTGCLDRMNPFRRDTLLIKGLSNRPALSWQGGGHPETYGAWLTCQTLRPTAQLENDVSVDQLLIPRVGEGALLSSLQVGVEPAALGDTCPVGFPCAYEVSISWKGPGHPLPPIDNPRVLFHTLFPANRSAREQARESSLLDAVLSDAGRLKSLAGAADRRRLDAWMDGIRHIERRVQAQTAQCGAVGEPVYGCGGLGDDGCVELYFDLITAALSCDVTRVMTITLGRAASERHIQEVSPQLDHHLASHARLPSEIAVWERYTEWMVERVASLTARLDSTLDFDGSRLLDNTLMFADSNMSDGFYHSPLDLPMIAVGSGAGLCRGDRVLHAQGRPLADLWLGLLHQLGDTRPRFGVDGATPLLLT